MTGGSAAAAPAKRKRSIVFNLALLVVVSIMISSAAAYLATSRIQSEFYAGEKASQIKAYAEVIATASRNAVAARKTTRYGRSLRKSQATSARYHT